MMRRSFVLFALMCTSCAIVPKPPTVVTATDGRGNYTTVVIPAPEPLPLWKSLLVNIAGPAFTLLGGGL